MKKKKRSLLKARLRRGELTISTFTDMEEDRTYWHRQTPHARLEAMEIMDGSTMAKRLPDESRRFLRLCNQIGSVIAFSQPSVETPL
jgi:hypothetical protein